MVMMGLDPESIAHLPADESCVVCAGPGTGKTRLLVQRLTFLGRSLSRPGAGVACITYTNAAADEISDRLEAGVRPAFLGTIHSFLLQHIVYPYGWWLDGVPADFDLVTTGYAVPHLAWMRAQGLISRQKAHVADIMAAFEMIGYDLDGNLKNLGQARLTQGEMRAFVDRRLSKGQVSQQDVLWFAWKILSSPEWKHVLDALSCRFSAILVDEFQDTTELQYAVLKKLHECGRTALFLVGDREQSIFSFAGSSLSTYEAALGLFPTHPLFVSYRSTRRIVEFLNLFLDAERQLEAVAEWKDAEIPVYVLVGKVDDRVRLQRFMELRGKHGLVGGGRIPEYLVLSRGTERARHLAALSKGESGGPGDVFQRLEEKHPLLNAILRDVLRARRLLDVGEKPRAFRSLDRGLSRLILKANPGFGKPEEVGLTRNSWRVMVSAVLHEMSGLNDDDVRSWVASFAEKVKAAIVRAGGRKSGQKLILLGKLPENLRKKEPYGTAEALRRVDVSDELPRVVRTIHRAKGLEAEAVLVVAAPGGQFTQWMNPHGSGKPRKEEARIGYVGFSRAMKLLCIATESMSLETRNMLACCPSVKVVELG
jgi:DNA helicase-2/ATP-dependent DNA helicase PcrA